MTNDQAELDDEFYEEDDDEFEDVRTITEIKARYPNWTLVRVMSGWQKMSEMDEWLEENTTSKFARVGWGGSCSYSVGVMLECEMDAILFKLRYG